MTDDLAFDLRGFARELFHGRQVDQYATDRILEAAHRLEALEAEIEGLRGAATALRDDMVNRAKMNAWQNDGEIVVEAGAGVWARFCAALGEKQ